MVRQRFLQFVYSQSFPGSRLMLLTGISPPVAIMKIDHYIHIQFLSPLGLHNQIFRVAPVVMLLRIDPYTQADGIKPIFLHQSRTFTYFSSLILKNMSLTFHFGHPADISPLSKIQTFCGSSIFLRFFIRGSVSA